MDNTLGSRLKHAWNAFTNNRDPTITYYDIGPGYSIRPDRPRLSRGNERTIITSILNRIALDAASIDLIHCKLDDSGRFVENVNSKLNSCLTLSANIDQTGRAFRHDIYMSLLDEGSVAIVPAETTMNPKVTDSYDISSMRVGKIVEWFPQYVRISMYNERTGRKEEITMH